MPSHQEWSTAASRQTNEPNSVWRVHKSRIPVSTTATYPTFSNNVNSEHVFPEASLRMPVSFADQLDLLRCLVMQKRARNASVARKLNHLSSLISDTRTSIERIEKTTGTDALSGSTASQPAVRCDQWPASIPPPYLMTDWPSRIVRSQADPVEKARRTTEKTAYHVYRGGLNQSSIPHGGRHYPEYLAR
ncbi:hypothetical protein H2198_007227 [Neophaeococcomyces mojaviensis]|uniref:Uncharacterized protein n=1 Tax=Neophaeococcomyces mojaviensis TaxID=3383035 RepID=A0ACC3A127_9EURO|nr:hypothetical protein H2198_007227 [Knufia sp. JES_112]